MTDAESFCRLVLGLGPAAEAAAQAAAPGVDRVDAVAGAWLACSPELERRRATLSWEEPQGGPAGLPLAALADLERAAVVAQALGLAQEEVEQALGAAPGAAPGLLARGHAALAGIGLPGGPACARERERMAVADRPRTDHDDACAGFATAVATQRAQLARLAGGASHRQRWSVLRAVGTRSTDRGPTTDPDELDLAASVEPGGGLANPRDSVGSDPFASVVARATGSARALLEPRGRRARVAVGLGVLVLAGVAGFGLTSAFERDERGAGDGVVTATPVGPLPPGVGPEAP